MNTEKILASHSQGKSLTEWLSYLETIHTTEIELGLTRIKQVAQRLNIDLSFAKVITVAGTNGKGTTCAFLENSFLANHSTVAVYSSPHIEHFNERLRINKSDVTDEAFVLAFEQIEQARGEISLTYYEYTTLAAFLILMVNQPDFIILEVGLGGRLDATNIIDADIAVITTIDLDHQSFLGNTREAIGFEKAGIMRTDRLAVLGDRFPTQSVINHAKTIGCELYVREQQFNVYTQDKYWQWQFNEMDISGLNNPFIPQDNVATALTVLSLLNIPCSEESINDVIAKTKVPGRTEKFSKTLGYSNCDVILDVAHNPQAARYLADHIVTQQQKNNYERVIAVVGMLSDKDVLNTLLPMTTVIDTWYIGRLDSPRAAASERIAQNIQRQTQVNQQGEKKEYSVNCFDNIQQAFKIANVQAGDNDLIIVFGSFFTVADVRRLFV
jgi:dihydrofolate synthase / folylpolyglutamate synthase